MEKRITSPDWDWVDMGVSVVGFWDMDEGRGLGRGMRDRRGQTMEIGHILL